MTARISTLIAKFPRTEEKPEVHSKPSVCIYGCLSFIHVSYHLIDHL